MIDQIPLSKMLLFRYAFSMDDHMQKRWKEEVAAVQRTTDAVGASVDSGIINLVAALHLLGFPTSSSCEGHTDWGLPYPWVDIGTPSSDVEDQKDADAQKEKNAELFKRMQLLLETFYTSRTVSEDIRLGLYPYGLFGAFRLSSATNATMAGSLKPYQDEMRIFTEFLKNLFSCEDAKKGPFSFNYSPS